MGIRRRKHEPEPAAPTTDMTDVLVQLRDTWDTVLATSGVNLADTDTLRALGVTVNMLITDPLDPAGTVPDYVNGDVYRGYVMASIRILGEIVVDAANRIDGGTDDGRRGYL